MPELLLTPAQHAAEKAQQAIHTCLEDFTSFCLEAGAGAGKTYSLVKALNYLIQRDGISLLRNHQKIACITYTNVASNEISSRTDGHPAIFSSTIHGFCWSIVKHFQPALRNALPTIDYWAEKLKEVKDIRIRNIAYDEFGRRTMDDSHISLHHNDVISLTIKLMEFEKFRAVLAARYPILFIDEYQDTDKDFAKALISHFIDPGKRPLIGFFGDHWQKIYGEGCGKIKTSHLTFIGKEANFRSVPEIVECLNRMRPDLPQKVNDPAAEGTVAVYHTNDWSGTRRTGAHWAGDLPAEVAHKYLLKLRKQLTEYGWNLAPDTTKILMLTHNILAQEQGYGNLAKVFTRNDAFIKKEDPHIAFFVDKLEPACVAYEQRRFGEMFAALNSRVPVMSSHSDKVEWANSMDRVLALRATNTIGGVIDHLRKTQKPHLPDAVERKELELERFNSGSTTETSDSIDRVRKLREVSYGELIALQRFIDGCTPFSTKHGVKGAEFENVLVVFGRGWQQYDFNQFLEWAGSPSSIPSEKIEAFERNRNLFYVACSRPKKRLALLFTQHLSSKAMKTLADWFRPESLRSII